MPKITPEDASLQSLQGLHLWHAPLSSCSQRVRLALAETGRSFESNLVDLERGGHASEAYQKIHPKGLVPALVDDGALFIESVDIIQHVAREHPELIQNADPDLLARADAAQLDLKLLTFEFLFRGGPEKSDTEAQAFQSAHKNEWLKQFYRDFVAGFDPDRLRDAVARTYADFKHLDTILADGRRYLSGDAFTVADIAWLPNFHRFDLMGWPWDRTPHLAEWFTHASARPSYEKALRNWENADVNTGFQVYTQKRKSDGTDVSAFIG